MNRTLPGLIFLIAAIGCKERSTVEIDQPSVPEDVLTFVGQQGLPMSQPPGVFSTVAAESIVVFRVFYGPAQDCPSGCFYRTAYGIRRAEKIGWMHIEQYGAVVVPEVTYFSLDSSDAYIFSEQFFEQMGRVQYPFYQDRFLPWVARDEDTPSSVLLRIAEMLEISFNLSIAGNALLANPAVEQDRDVLTVLANLPDDRSSAYIAIRDSARVRLIALGE